MGEWAPVSESSNQGQWIPVNPDNGQTIGPGSGPPTSIIDDPQAAAGVVTQAISSLPTDEMARVKYFASKRFPDLPINDAVDKYSYKDNRLAYKGADGNTYFEDPSLSLGAITKPGDLQSMLGKVTASGAGPALPAIGSTLGGLMAMGEGPVGLLTGAPQAAGGGALFDIARQGLAHLFTGETKPFFGARVPETIGAGIQGGVSQIGGNTLARGLGALGLNQVPAYNLPDITERMRNAGRFGISLTPAEETGNRTLIARQRLLQNMPGADEIFANFYRNRNDQVSNAVDSVLGSLDPSYNTAATLGMPPPPPSSMFTSASSGARAGAQGAQAAVKGVQQELQTAAKPFYQSSLAPGNVIEPRTIQDALDPSQQTILNHVITTSRADPILGPKLQGWQDNSMYVLDQAKKNTDGLISAAQRDGDLNRVSILTGLKNKLTGIMDHAYPDYATARNIYTEGMPGRNEIVNGAVGELAGASGSDTLKATKALFSPSSSPEDIRTAKAAFQKADDAQAAAGQPRTAMQQWDALTGSYLRQVFNQVPDTAGTTIPNIGGMYRKAVYGNPQKRAMLTAAMDHNPRFQGDFNALMDTLDATSAASRSDSITAFAQAGQKQLQREGGGLIPAVLDSVEFWNAPSNVANYLRDINTAKYANRQAELFTTPEGRSTLKELRKLGPKSNGAVMALSNFLTAGGVSLAGRTLAPNPDGPVSGASTTPGGP